MVFQLLINKNSKKKVNIFFVFFCISFVLYFFFISFAFFFACDHMANLLRLTDELGNFGFWIDGPEIWPVQNWGGGRGGG